MKTFKRFLDFLRVDLWSNNLGELSKKRRVLFRFLRVCMLALKGFRDDKCSMHSSALTCSAVMALVPTLIIAFAFAKGFGMDWAQKYLLDFFEKQPVAIESTATPGPKPEFVAKNISLSPKLPWQLREPAERILKTVEEASAARLGTISTIVFLWIVIRMLSRVEESFNDVWGVKDSRRLLDKTRNYVFVLTIAPLLVIFGISAMPVLLMFQKMLSWMGPVLSIALKLVPVLSMTVAFMVVYLTLPNTRVKFVPAFIGAFIASIFSIILQILMIRVGVGVSGYNELYGVLAALPIFLFWLKYSWIIMLFGAELAFAVQNSETIRFEQIAEKASPEARLFLAFTVLKQILDGFSSESPIFNAQEYALKNRIPVRLMNSVIYKLSDAGLITESVSHPQCYTLLKAPLSISVKDVYNIILKDGASLASLGASDLPKRVEDLMVQIDETLMDKFGAFTLQS